MVAQSSRCLHRRPKSLAPGNLGLSPSSSPPPILLRFACHRRTSRCVGANGSLRSPSSRRQPLSIRAVGWLMTNSNLLDCTTGKSAGFAPLRIVRHSELIVALAGRHRLPAVYFDRAFVAGGGLCSYGPDPGEQYPPGARHRDPLPQGGKPADLPGPGPPTDKGAVNTQNRQAFAPE